MRHFSGSTGGCEGRRAKANAPSVHARAIPLPIAWYRLPSIEDSTTRKFLQADEDIAMNWIRVLECIGAVAGILGAALIASNTAFSGYGWIGFSISSVLLSGFAIYIRAWWMLSMQICFSITNAVGLWRWLIEPALTG